MYPAAELYSARTCAEYNSARRLKAGPTYIVKRAAISSIPSHKFWMRRFSLNVC